MSTIVSRAPLVAQMSVVVVVIGVVGVTEVIVVVGHPGSHCH